MSLSVRLPRSVASRRNRVAFGLSALLLLSSGAALQPAQAQITATYQNASVVSTGALGMNFPTFTAVDGAGDLYIASTSYNQIVEVAASGTASLVSTGTLTLAAPFGVAVDGAGDLYIADSNHNRVVEVAAGGAASVVSTGALGLAAPSGVAVDGAGDLYIADTNNNRIVEVAAGGAASVVSTGTLTLAAPYGVAVDGTGDLYIADSNHNRVVEVAAGGAASVVNAVALGLATPHGVAVDGAGNLYIADTNHNRVVEVAAGGAASQISTGSLTLLGLFGVAVDGAGDLYIADTNHTRVVEVASSQNLGSEAVGSTGTSVAMSYAVSGYSGSYTPKFVLTYGAGATIVSSSCTGGASPETCTANVALKPTHPGAVMNSLQVQPQGGGVALTTTPVYGTGTGPYGVFVPDSSTVLNVGQPGGVGLTTPHGVAEDNNGNRFIADTFNNRIVEYSAGGAASVVATTGFTLSSPSGIVVDGEGNLFFADSGNNRILEHSVLGVTSVVNLGVQTLSNPQQMAIDGVGNLYVADPGDNRIVKIEPNGAGAGVVNVGSPSGKALSQPVGVAIDAAGNLFISDTGNNRVVELPNVGAAFVLNVGSLSAPAGIAVDAADDVYIATGNSVVQYAVGGPAVAVNTGSNILSSPEGVAIDATGNLYIVDTSDDRIVENSPIVTPTLSFATTNAGSTSADSPQDEALQNIGNQALNFTALTVSTNFNLSGPTTCTASTSLTSGQSCVAGVEFAPTTSGYLTGTVRVADNNLNNTASSQLLSLNGTGVTGTATMTLTENPGLTISYGTTTTVTATLTGTNGTPTGQVGFDLDGSGYQYFTLNASGVASYTTAATLSAGTHTLLVRYAGSGYYAASTAPQSLTITVNAETTATNLTVSPGSTVNQGTNIQFTATTIASPGSTSVYPSGTMTFYDGATAIGSANMNGVGQATFNISTLTAGTHNISAVYLGNGNIGGSTSNTIAVDVASITTTTALTASATTLDYGAADTLTATVKAASGATPAGTVTFYNGTTALGTGTLSGTGVATLTTNNLPVGTDSVTASYAGSGNDGPSTSNTVMTTVSLSASAPDVIAIDSGYTGTYNAATMGAFQPDEDYSGGNLAATGNTVNTGNAINPAPEAIYQTERWGVMSYTIPNLLPGATYTVRLHFAEIFLTQPGQRIFNVAINGSPVLKNFDIVAAAGGANIAITEPFEATADTNGNISISFTNGPINNPKISGIEILASEPTTTTLAATPTTGTYGTSVALTATVTGTGFTPSGMVVFYNGTTALGTAALNGSGVATLTTTALSAGTDSVTAAYAGTGNYGPSVSAAQVITLNPAALTLVADNATRPYNTVNPNFAGTITYNGSPYAESNGGSFTGANGDTFTVNFITTATQTSPVGTYSIVPSLTATGTANLSNYTVTPTDGTLTVSSDTTSAVLSASGTNVPYGTNVTLTATLTDTSTSPSTPITSGTVTFYNGANPIGSGALNASGVATLSTTTLPAGANSISAQFAGSGSNTAGTSNTLSVVVTSNTTTTTLTAGSTSISYGQSLALTAKVVPSAGSTPAGMVTFYNGTVVIGTGALNGSGVATLNLSTLPAGTDTLSASYAASGGDLASTSNSLVVAVSGDTTTTVLTPSTASTFYGQNETLTATVTGNAGGTPVGTVTFYNGSTVIGTGTLNAAGSASLTLSTLPVGTNPVSASYAGQGEDGGSTGNTSVTVYADQTTATLSASSASILAGQNETLTVAVTSPNGSTPAGTVTFLNGAATLGTGTLNASGMATLSTTALPVGTNSIDVTYAANGNDAGATSNTVVVTVTTVQTATVLTSSATSIAQGQSVTFTAAVSGANGSAPAGTVNFYDGTTFLGAGTLNASGVTALSTATLPVGTNTITASFVASGIYAASTSSAVTVQVSALQSTTVLTSSASSVNQGQSVTFTAVVTTSNGMTPSGLVTFDNGTVFLGTGTLDATGTATLSTTALPVGTDTITALYAGGTSNPVTVTVFAAQTPTVQVALGSSSLTIKAGSTGLDSVQLTPQGGYMGTLQFACQGLPQAATCVFNPTTLDINSAAQQTVTLSIETTAPVAAVQPYAPLSSPTNPMPMLAGAFWLPGLLAAGVGLRKKKMDTRARHLLVLLVLLAGVGMMTACAGGAPTQTGTSTPPPTSPTTPVTPTGTTTVQVVVTGPNGLSQSVPLSLTIQ